MKTQIIKKKKGLTLLPIGAFNEIAKIVGCHRHTVRCALRNNTKGLLSEKCREVAREKYGI